VSAVGHEIDFTISDFAADLRAPTPSAAAELVVPDQGELNQRLLNLGSRLKRVVHGRIDRLSDQLDYYERGIFSQSSERKLQQPIFRIEGLKRDLTQAVDESMKLREHMLSELQFKLERYHPREIFKRRQEKVERITVALTSAAGHALDVQQTRVDRLGSLLQALGPGSILERGFSIAFGADGEIVKSTKDVSSGEELTVQVSDGKIKTKVEE